MIDDCLSERFGAIAVVAVGRFVFLLGGAIAVTCVGVCLANSSHNSKCYLLFRPMETCITSGV